MLSRPERAPQSGGGPATGESIVWHRNSITDHSPTGTLRAVAASRGCTVRVHRGTHLSAPRGAISGTAGDRLRLGAQWPGRPFARGYFVVRPGGRVDLRGSFSIYTGSEVCVDPGATLSLGTGYANTGLRLDCYSRIEIGDGGAIGPDVLIRDSDNHSSGSRAPQTAPILISDRVWVGARSMILKGVTIGTGAVIAAGSVVVRDVPAHALVAGNPARVRREGVRWT